MMPNRLPLLLAVLLATTAPALAARVVPMCNNGVRYGLDLEMFIQPGVLTEAELAMQYQQRLRARGINANNVRFWNGCLQAFVRENGHETMRFYDPASLEEIPLDR